jgi:hypothetical protein
VAIVERKSSTQTLDETLENGGATGTNFGPASKMGKVEKFCFSFA